MIHPRQIAQEIVDELLSRKGIGDELESVDDDVMEEIIESIAEIISEGVSV